MAHFLMVDRDEIHSIIPVVCKNYNERWGRWVRQAIVFVGAPGTGKTTESFSLAEHPDLVAWYNERTGLTVDKIPVYVATCHPDGTAPEYIGTYLPLDGNWSFQPGPMLRSWGYGWHNHGKATALQIKAGMTNVGTDQKTGYDHECNVPPPGKLLVDDIHLMGPGGMAALYKMMDNGQGGSFLDPWGKLIYPHEASLVDGTMNGEIDSLDPAVVDRVAVKCPVTMPSAEMLSILAPDLAVICKEDYTQSGVPIATFREWQSISQLRPQLGLSKAVMLALGKFDRAERLIEALSKIEATLVTAGIIPATTEARDAMMELKRAQAAGV